MSVGIFSEPVGFWTNAITTVLVLAAFAGFYMFMKSKRREISSDY